MHIDSDRPPICERASLVDRRSLSEAWYNALHFADRSGGSHQAPAAHDAKTFVAGKSHGARVAHERDTQLTQGARAILKSRTRALALPPEDPGREASPAVRRTASLVADRTGTRGSGVTIAFGKTRVAVFVRRAREGVRVVAICSPREEAAVRRALAHAAASGASLLRCDVVAIGAGR